MFRDLPFIAFVTSVITYVIEILLALRVLLKMFGANPLAPFVAWVYETTRPLLTPFIGMFPSPRVETFVIEFSALFALIVYLLAGELLITFIAYIENNFLSQVRKPRKKLKD